MSKKIRVRFAPSPTGLLHIGNIRAGIFNWLFAKHHGGEYVVRIEDTDRTRSKPEYTESIMKAMEWLGILPDEPIIHQLDRIEEHKKLLKGLLDKGVVYPCFCEKQDADERVSQLEKGIGHKYDGTCRNKPFSEEDLKKPHALRFKLPEGREKVEFVDLVRDNIAVNCEQLDDFVVMRQEGVPTYNFCVVADDIFSEITHVIRGEDHISNTPKQILLYEALGADIPKFAHLPLILGPAGNKLSKRDAAVSVDEYHKMGFLADAFFNYLVRLGWSHGDQEIFSREELVEYFDFDHVGKKGAIFDIQKLSWLNGMYIKKLEFYAFIEEMTAILPDRIKKLTDSQSRDIVSLLFEQYRDRETTLVAIIEKIESLFEAPEMLDCSLIVKWVTDQTPKVLEEFSKALDEMEELHHDPLLAKAKEICKEHEVKLVGLAQPLRLAITGSSCSPGIFELMTALSRDEIKNRIQKLIERLRE